MRVAANDLSAVQALTFDVFGTVVDWRGSIIREGRELARAKGIRVDWPAFADAWRAGYRPAMDQVRRGDLPLTNLDALHRLILDSVLDRFGLSALDAAERDHLNRVWHRLRPWPDAVPGLRRLRRRFITAPLSNGNLALLTNMARHAGLPWDCILSADIARHYKPDREVYETAVALLDLAPEQILMVAAHPDDLQAAARTGIRTAFVPRPREWGLGRAPDVPPDVAFDLTASDFGELAGMLGA
jgi:2-haloacid dehalogenase